MIRKKVSIHKNYSIYSYSPSANWPAAKLKFPQKAGFYSDELTFTFLNITHTFSGEPAWNEQRYGKLWTYNLNYFEFLMDQKLSREVGLKLIHHYISSESKLIDGKEPYPVSLRLINWCKFIMIHGIQDETINRFLYADLDHLGRHPEYHLGGNHLLENGFALSFAGFAMGHSPSKQNGLQLIREELNEQILSDGAHYERSPMYHNIILERLLDLINLIQQSSPDHEELSFLREIAVRMISWLHHFTFKDGSIPLLNDASPGIAMDSFDLIKYANNLCILPGYYPPGPCGYRTFSTDKMEIVMDVGEIGPDDIPGHAHSDTLNFVVQINSSPFIVDTGVSIYEKNARRQLERSTISHNTVVVNGEEQSDVWGGFRVGRRARPQILMENQNVLKATHDGYMRFDVLHERTFELKESKCIIYDRLIGEGNFNAYLHLDYTLYPKLTGLNQIQTKVGEISFEGAESVDISTYKQAIGFNKIVNAPLIRVSFKRELTTIISSSSSPS